MDTLLRGVVGSHDPHQTSPLRDQFHHSLESLRRLVVADETQPPSVYPYDAAEMHCLFGLAMADSDQDSVMSKDEYYEYVKFILGESSGQQVQNNYASLPTSLKDNFDSFATDQEIPIVGSDFLPLEQEKSEDIDWLMLLCEQTKQELVANNLLADEMTASIERSPKFSVSTEILECIYAMALADLDRDLLLNQTNFADFVYLLTGTYQDEDYEDFHSVLKSTYAFFATSPIKLEIDVYGSYYPLQHNNVTEAKLLRLNFCCKSTKEMVWELNTYSDFYATPAPVPLLQVQVESDFVVSNKVGLTAEDALPDSSTWGELEQAYDMTARAIVNERAELARQELDDDFIHYVAESGSVKEIKDVACPHGDKQATCQLVSASFSVEIDETKGTSIPFPEEFFATNMDDAIQEGKLQDNLLTVNPGTVYKVVTEHDKQEEEEEEEEEQVDEIDPQEPAGTDTQGVDTSTTKDDSTKTKKSDKKDVALILSCALFGVALLLFGMALVVFRRSARGRTKRGRQQSLEDETVCSNVSD